MDPNKTIEPSMENRFLLYTLYITLIEIRERGYELNDKRIFWLCDLVHNIPLTLTTEEDTQQAYTSLLEKVQAMGIHDWLTNRKKEFYDRYPEYRRDDEQ
jgi:hypothetical protein